VRLLTDLLLVLFIWSEYTCCLTPGLQIVTISAIDRVRLEGLLGMLGSEHLGERDNAAKLVEQFRRDRGLSWADLLVSHPLGPRATDPPGHSPWPSPYTARTEMAGQTFDIRNVFWRWSMLAGIAVVGLISLISLHQQSVARQPVPAEAVADRRCPIGSQATGWPACEPSRSGINVPVDPPAPSAADGGRPPSTAFAQAFAQGLADRKLWETWNKAATPELCAGHFSANQKELKSACMTAQKLLKQFDQRRRTDPDYRRGWNSQSS